MKKTENCLHCDEIYTPKRVGIQKFCSNSCRSRYWYLNNKPLQPVLQYPVKIDKKKKKKKEKKIIQKPDTINLPGIGNAAIGAAAIEVVKNILTPADNKPVTIKEFNELKSFIRGRYLPVNNVVKDIYGKLPYYDVETSNIVYFFEYQIK